MKSKAKIAILIFTTAAGVLAADSLADEVQYEWINISARRDVSDLLPSAGGYYIAYRGGGAAYYDITKGSYRSYGLEQGLTHLYVSGVAEDDEYLYFGTRNGLAKLDRVTGEYERIIRMWGNAYNDCTGVAVTDRYIYVSTIEGARRFDKDFGLPVEVMKLKAGERPLSKQIDDGWEIYYSPDDVVTEDLYSVVIGEDGTAYWGGHNRIPVQHPDDSWSVIEPNIDIGNIGRMRFIENRLAIFGKGGGFYCDTETGQCESIVSELTGTSIKDAMINGEYIYLGGPAGLYLTKTDGKKFKLPFGTPVESIGKKKKKKKSDLWLISDEIGGNGVNRIIAQNGIIIIGTTDGVYHYDPDEKEFVKADIPGGLSGPAVYSLYRDGDTLWAVGSGGVDRILLGETNYNITTSYPLSETVRDVALFGDDVVALGSNALYRLENERPERVLVFAEDIIAGQGRHIQSYEWFGEEKLFIGTSERLFALNRDFEIDDSFHGLRGYDIVGVEASGDTLYAATHFNGIYGFTSGGDNKSAYFADGYTGLSGEEIISLYAADENVYVGLYEKGVDILTPELAFVDNITWGDGLSHTDIFAVAYDAPYLWVSIRDVGVNAYNLETGEREGIRKYYARYDLGDEFCRDIEVLAPGDGYDHRIAFATASGVSILCYTGDTPPDLTVGDPDRNYR